jgi:pimeloyl-ACP methyl ester carboxylesterase
MMMSCAHKNKNSEKTILLVHGAHFAGESFTGLVDELEKFKIYSEVIQLKKHSEATLTDYANNVCEHLNKVGKTLVLGHSQGGAVINQAYGICPDKILGFIYVAATIPFPDEKPFALLTADDDEYYFKAVKEDMPAKMFKITDQMQFIQGFAQDAIEKDIAVLNKQMQDEPMLPSQTLVRFDLEQFQKTPKVVIHTVLDRIITLPTQKKYSERLKNTKITYVNSSHLPMLTRPYELARAISAEFY